MPSLTRSTRRSATSARRCSSPTREVAPVNQLESLRAARHRHERADGEGADDARRRTRCSTRRRTSISRSALDEGAVPRAPQPYYDETSMLCHWHVPETHYLETWSDARAHDGTVSIMQPLIAPLYNGRAAIEVLGVLVGGLDRRRTTRFALTGARVSGRRSRARCARPPASRRSTRSKRPGRSGSTTA